MGGGRNLSASQFGRRPAATCRRAGAGPAAASAACQLPYGRLNAYFRPVLQFFNRPLPGRLLVLLGLLLAVMVPLWLLADAPLTLAELRQQLLAERLAADGPALYRELFTTEAPLAVYLWRVLAWVAPAPPLLAYRVVAGGLLIGQALYLNSLLHRRGVLSERTWVPVLVYVLAGAIWWELDSLTPLRWGQTFLLIAFGNLTVASREGYDNRNIFQGGLLLGVAGLCHPPLLLFALVAVLTMVIFAANFFRSALLLVVGILFPYASLGTAYLYTDTLAAFLDQHLVARVLWPFQPVALVPPALTWTVLALPAALLVVAALRSLERGGQLNYQARFRQVMLAWLGVAALMVAAGNSFTPASVLEPFLPPLAYFSPALVGRGPRAWLNDVLFGVWFGGLVAVRYAVALGLTAWLPGQPAALVAAAAPTAPSPTYGLNGQRLLVLGRTDWRAYAGNRPGSPYFDWPLAAPDFNHLDSYGALYRLSRNFRTNRPDLLLDPARRYVPTLRQRLPLAFGDYHEVYPGLWQRDGRPPGSPPTPLPERR